MKWTLPILLLISFVFSGCGSGGPEGQPSDAAVAAMNRGLAQLEMFRYLPAAEEFEEAIELAPEWTDAKVNLAISWLNIRGKYHDRALALLEKVLASDPDNLHALFVSGVILKVSGYAEKAKPLFERVLEKDPGDAASHFWVGACLIDMERKEEADLAFQRAIQANPYLAAAYYRRHSTLTRMRRKDEAAESLSIALKLKDPPPGKQFPIVGDLLTAKAYHEIGKYAMAIRNYPDVTTPPPSPHRPSFLRGAAFRYGAESGPELVPVERHPGETDRAYVERVVCRIGPGVVVGDYDGDRLPDIFLPEWNGPGKLLRNEGKLAFRDVTADSGIATRCRGIAGAFFDGDGDGDLDLYVTAAGKNVYYENRGDGTFADRTAETGLAGGDVVSLGVLPTDFDQEGDVDLFVANYCRADDAGLAGAPDALYQNNRDGTFTDVAEERGVAGGDARSLGALALDVDHDLDPDFLVIRDRGPAALWLNERIWSFRSGDLPRELTTGEPAWGAAAGDIDHDGYEEVIVFRGPGANADLFRAKDGALEPIRSPISAVRWRTGIFLDADLDGNLDLVGDDIVLLDGALKPLLPLQRTRGERDSDGRGMAFADLDGNGTLDRFSAGAGFAEVIGTVGPWPNHWLAIELIGREALQPVSWSAKVGPGHELELRAGRLWQPLRARATTGFLSTIEAPIRFGLGKRTKAELVRILWADRVLQVEAEIPADQVKRIEELNRKPTSCPMLFAWDGSRFRYVTDFLGVGGLGFFIEPGVYGESDPDEYVRIGEWLRPEDGKLVLQILEPLEEISYLDELTLLAVDHPSDMEVFPNERYVGEKARFPKPRIYGVRKKIFPRKATDIEGNDILPILREVDREYAPVRPDRRFAGVAEEHAVVLDFTGRVPEIESGERLVLFLDGWIEYGYSKTFFAAYQAKVECFPPRLEVPDGKGGWETLVENTGCPAGMPKGMTLDVTGLVTPERPLFRIRTNYEVYWDRIFLGVDEAPGRIRVTRIAPSVADLHDRGYPREYSPDGRQPILYDYGLMDPGYPFKNMAGDYTRFGDVRPLTIETDDRYVIMGHGEELTLAYPVSALPELGKGKRRTFLLYTSGWCKDMDPYTAHPDTVGPLPFRGMKSYPYAEGEAYPDDPELRAYRREWNTRKKHGR